MHERPKPRGPSAKRFLTTALVYVTALLLPAIVLLVLTLHDAGHQREQAEARARIAIGRASEHAALALQGGLLALERLDDLTGPIPWPQIQTRRAALATDLRRMELGLPAVVGLVMVRPDGRIALSAGAEPTAQADLSAIDAFRRLREGNRGPYFDIAPRDVFPAALTLLAGRGRVTDGRAPDGLLLTVLRGQSLIEAWKAFAAPGGRFALLRDDGSVLLRSDAGEGPFRPLAPGAPLRAVMESGNMSPVLGDPFGDGRLQMVVWQRVGALPLAMVYTSPPPLLTADQLLASPPNIAVSIVLGLALLLFALRVRGTERNDSVTLERLEANAAELQAEITRREAAEEGLRNAQRLEGLGRLTGGVAHDFNNLLTAVLGTARSLERHLGPSADERTKRLIAATVAAVERGARLNASLLAFARRQPLTLATVDANALVRNFLPLLRRALDETMAVELSLDARLPVCQADSAQLEAALLNLAINARDAMPKGGTLRIVTRRAWLQEQALAGNTEAQPGPYVAIEVRDTGQGMAAEVRERAFEPFFTTKAPGQGTGLGLSQVFGFMRQIGGHVSIQSTPGQGTMVTLYLPLGSAAEPAAGGTVPTPRAQALSGDGCAVLVVEDEPAVRAVAVDMLQDAGFTVLAAPDGPTALALLREGAHADILFSDVMMPGGMTGVDLAREARRLRPSIGVLLASGYAAEALAQHGGADEFDLIGKPYDSDVVLSRLVAQRQRQLAQA